jgi:hypothetical protein
VPFPFSQQNIELRGSYLIAIFSQRAYAYCHLHLRSKEVEGIPETVRILMWLGSWLVLAAIIGMAVGQNCFRYYRLRKAGVVVQGITLERKPHAQILYRFEANGQTYESIGRTADGYAPSANRGESACLLPSGHSRGQLPWRSPETLFCRTSCGVSGLDGIFIHDRGRPGFSTCRPLCSSKISV